MDEIEALLETVIRDGKLQHHQSIEIARAVLSALHDAGYSVVPNEPTEEMVEAMSFAYKKTPRPSGAVGMTIDNQFKAECAREFATYRAMLAASPIKKG